MTILVSVLSEAYQSRYSTMMHNGLFDKAIRSYQNKTHSNRQASHSDTPIYDKDAMTVEERQQALDETRVEIAAIPPKIIAQAKVFHAHLQYVLTHNTQDKPPPGLQRALDELMDEEAMNEDLRKEVLQDGDARRTLFMMSFERTLKRMVENAERISKLIEERESLEGGLEYGLGQDNEDDVRGEEDEDENGFADSPTDMRHQESLYDIPDAKRGNPWLKLRSGLLGAKALRSNVRRGSSRPYMHARGSQSEPHLTINEEEDENDGLEDEVDKRPDCTETGTPSSSSKKSRTRQPPKLQPSKLSAVRFADNPYDDDGSAGNEKPDRNAT